MMKIPFSPPDISQAEIEELLGVAGMTLPAAEAVYNHFHNENDDKVQKD